VVVGDDVAGVVPDEAGAGAEGDLLDVAAEELDLIHHGRDVDDGGRGLLEEPDGALLGLAEVGAGGDGPRLGRPGGGGLLRHGRDEGGGTGGAAREPEAGEEAGEHEGEGAEEERATGDVHGGKLAGRDRGANGKMPARRCATG
jgi:hypothetical protein